MSENFVRLQLFVYPEVLALEKLQPGSISFWILSGKFDLVPIFLRKIKIARQIDGQLFICFDGRHNKK